MQYTTSKAVKGQRKGKGTEHTQREGAGAHHLHSVDMMKHLHERNTRHYTLTPLSKNMFRFCRLLSPKIPRKHQSTPKKNSLLPLFALIRCPFDLVSVGGVWKQGRMNACLIYSGHTKRDTPPHWRSGKCPLPP